MIIYYNYNLKRWCSHFIWYLFNLVCTPEETLNRQRIRISIHEQKVIICIHNSRIRDHRMKTTKMYKYCY